MEGLKKTFAHCKAQNRVRCPSINPLRRPVCYGSLTEIPTTSSTLAFGTIKLTMHDDSLHWLLM